MKKLKVEIVNEYTTQEELEAFLKKITRDLEKLEKQMEKWGIKINRSQGDHRNRKTD